MQVGFKDLATVRHLLGKVLWLLTIAVLSVSTGQASAAELGDTVTNVARVAWSNGGQRVNLVTNEATIRVEAAQTDSTIEFFRYAPSIAGSTPQAINGSDYSSNGSLTGSFIPIGPAVNPGNTPIDLSSPIPLLPAEAFLTGEVMFVRVTDAGQNGNSNRIETVVVTIEVTTGDSVVLRLYESGPDTGEFFGYVPSVQRTTPINDTLLTTSARAGLTAVYVDSFDASETSIDTALIDPFGRVFNALTGELLDGIPVTLIDSSTGRPATVFGIDGVSSFPSSIITGSRVVDDSGLVYDLAEGEFRFPLVPPGTYEIRVDEPDGFRASSIVDPRAFEDFDAAPFSIIPASYGGEFVLDAFGPASFDIPIDPASDLLVSKFAEASEGDVGDFIRYTVTLENLGDTSTPIVLRDIAPRGFRYVPGSSRIGADESSLLKASDPEISDDGTTLDYQLGSVAPAEMVTVAYVMQIGAGVDPGDAVNAAMAIDRFGDPISNIARFSVTIREDLFRTKTTIIGRVAEQACNADDEWAREIGDGIGIEGVRIYLETGVYAVTDEDGLYHFEDVTAGTHVVQVDRETLPLGFEPMVCEENSRYAGSATSKFIDVQGGNIWRANFYLNRTGDLASALDLNLFNDLTEYKKFDREWLDEQDASVEWVYPAPARTPSQPSVNIGIKHAPGQKVVLSINSEPVPKENFEGRDSDSERSVLLSRWRGIDLKHGRNDFTVTIKSDNGDIVETFDRDIWFVTEAKRAIEVVDQSILVADGRTSPVLAVRMEDNAGRPVHAGRKMTVEVTAPYRLETTREVEDANELTSPLSARGDITVGTDGIARIRLEPTLQTGRVNLLVNLDDGRQVPIEMYLKPEKRDWIVVGLAEGTIGYETLRSKGSGTDSDDVFTDGRVAFFAKGVVKGEWLLTLQVDTDKSRANRDDDFEEEIDPNAYYTLYGDRSYQQLETPSRYPLYVKLEKNQFYAMFGDYDTNLIDAELTAYTRRLSGFKTEYVGDRFRVVAFGSESNQGFVKDELAADGTSGPYQLSNDSILVDSETIILETRDRFRPDIVVETTLLVRHLDYTIDYLTGEIIFRLPVAASDASLNPNVIVVDYETDIDAERNFTYGARASGDFLDGRVTAGAAYIREGGDVSAADSNKEVAGVDIVARPAPGWEARVELAHSRSDLDGVKTEATAWLAEVTYRSAQWTAELYAREEEENFGLGQQSSSTSGARRAGVSASYEFDRTVDEETGTVTARSVQVEAYHEENLSNGSTRILGDVSVSQETDRYGVSVGLRHVEDDVSGSNGDPQSTLATVSGRLSIPEYRATLTASHEQPLTNNDDVNEFPQRTTVGVSKVINRWATVNVTHEYRNGDDIRSNITAAGVQLTPWTGGSVTLGSDLQTQDSSRRLGATVGLDQTIKINDNWVASVGFTNQTVLNEDAPLGQIIADDAVSPLELSEDYTSGYIGAGYRSQWTSASVRFETRLAEGGDTHTASASVSRELSETFSVAGTSRVQYGRPDNLGDDENDTLNADARLGLAWRPRVEGPVVLNRLDLQFDRTRFGDSTTKVVNNFAANSNIGDRTQVAGHYGVKYVKTEFGGTKYSGWTHLLGAEARFDVTKHVDLGIHGSILYVPGSGTTEYAWGPSIGVSPVDNVWMSLGYNFDGFADEDFDAARFTRQGLFVKLRLKFDENTARSILNMLSPYDE